MVIGMASWMVPAVDMVPLLTQHRVDASVSELVSHACLSGRLVGTRQRSK